MLKSDRWVRKLSREHDMSTHSPGAVRRGRDLLRTVFLWLWSKSTRECPIFTNVNNALVDPKHFDERSFVTIQTDICIVPPNSFALARSVEYFKIPRSVLATICVGNSTYARCGIIVNVTPSSRVGRFQLPWKSRTLLPCRREFMPTRDFAKSSSSSPTRFVKPATRTGKASTRRRRESCCRNYEQPAMAEVNHPLRSAPYRLSLMCA